MKILIADHNKSTIASINEFNPSFDVENTNYSDNTLPRCNSYSHLILNELNEYFRIVESIELNN